MSRPINADARATQRRILGSARRAFADHGVTGISVREIARRAGVSVAMVNHYFGSKEGLYAACIAAMHGDLDALGARLASELVSGETAPAAVLERAVRAGWRFARENRDVVRLLQRSIVEEGEVDEKTRKVRMLPFLDAVSRRLEAATGRPAAAFRLSLQSGVFLVVRYGIASERELAELAFADSDGVSRSAEEAASAIEDHLAASVLTMLGLPATPTLA